MTNSSLRWVKSSYSDNGGQCIEWARDHAVASGVVPVRDSKDPHGPALAFSASSWSSFVTNIKGGALPTV
ncbi:hypothetical protein SSP35_01_02980 [Streptomyces sp. NBRC 110611]|uniref:DUF397 domain-containing protein n=1 Tax=Streptomyces sp. NBRC 110611 TaxID=1621259 RepID=UPI0008315D6F|nr:DUF397 domain-containing protein [Streptomyces sp. NBRC 110611]GAU64961.1 hypothetical protein SSP35_01_02980 [Streptomyces sp. NBRC 110611]